MNVSMCYIFDVKCLNVLCPSRLKVPEYTARVSKHCCGQIFVGGGRASSVVSFPGRVHDIFEYLFFLRNHTPKYSNIH